MAQSKAKSKYEAVKEELRALGWARPGCVTRRYMPCGNPNCRCMADPPQLHGPYYQWSHKIGGKTRSLRLSEAQARQCREWAANYKKLRKLVRRLEALALKETDRLLGAISRS
jgi:hypothetical protein